MRISAKKLSSVLLGAVTFCLDYFHTRKEQKVSGHRNMTPKEYRGKAAERLSP